MMPKVRFKVHYRNDDRGDIDAGTVCDIIYVSNDHVAILPEEACYGAIPVCVSYDAMRAATEPYSDVKRAPAKEYPSNWEECFEMLWTAKGRKGSKAKARDKFKALSEGATQESCEAFTKALIEDVQARQDELGMAEMHLTTYLNQARWEK